MVGPGLFFALLALGALPARASEATVGLDAKGVDPLVALHNDSGLDIRDALGRPVSAQKVATELKQAQAKAASEAAFASRLPQAAAVAALLEMIQVLRLALRGGPVGLPPISLFALAPARRTGKEGQPGLIVAVALSAAMLAGAAACRPEPALQFLRAPATEVLRC